MGRITKHELAPKLSRQIDANTHFIINPYIHTYGTLEDITRTFGDVYNYDETDQRTILYPKAMCTRLDYVSSKYGTFPTEKINGLCVVDSYTKQIAVYCEDGWYVNGKLLLLITDFLSDKEENQCIVGDTVHLTVSAQGDGELLYKYAIADIDTKHSYTLKDYSNSNEYDWKPTVQGNKLLTIYVKNNNDDVLEVSKTLVIKVLPSS